MPMKNEGPIAIVGMGCVFPNAFNTAHYWKTLQKGDVSFMPVPAETWDNSLFYSNDRRDPEKYYDNIISYPHGFKFDASKFKCDPSLLSNIGRRDQYIFTALNECFSELKNIPARTKFYMGHTAVSDPVNSNLLVSELMRELSSFVNDKNLRREIEDELHKAVLTDYPKDSLSGQMTHKKFGQIIKSVVGKDFPFQLIDAACASSLFTIELGIQDLLNGEIDLAFCGGMTFSDPFAKVLFCRLGGSSRFGCFPFQSRADGTVFGDSAGLIAIKRLEDAIKDGDQIHAVIRGLGTASDGKGKSIYAPNYSGQVLAMERAYQRLNIEPQTVQYVEAHGTGTPAGDSTEYKSLETFFSKYFKVKDSLGLGSVKGIFGHLGWAAGTASVIKMALSLKNKKIPAQHNFETVNPAINLAAGPFFITRQMLDWPQNNKAPRRAGINGFGFGGTNAHLIIEEFAPETSYPKSAAPTAEVNDDIVVVGVGCFLPGADSWESATKVLESGNPSLKRFSPAYKPNNIKFRTIDRAASVIDNAQFMALEATSQVLSALGDSFKELKDHTGAFVAHVGSMNKQLGQMRRVFSDSITSHILKNPNLSKNSQVQMALEFIKKNSFETAPPANEDTNPGLMPNVTPGRMCNVFDLHGPNFSVNSGVSSMTQTMRTAISSLNWNKCQVALVAAANSSILPSYEKMWEQWTGQPGAEVAEGALCFALMRSSEAAKRNLKPLAKIKISQAQTSTGPEFNIFKKIEKEVQTPFGYFLSAPDSHVFLKSVYEAAVKNKATSYNVVDENGDVWSVDAEPAQAVSKVSSDSFYIDQVIIHSESEFMALRTLDDARDKYLSHHLVRGKPTLPGTFMLEIAAEATKKFTPEFHIAEIRDISFQKFIRTPIDLKIKATVIGHDKTSKMIQVSLLSDFKNKAGVVLQKDTVHFTCTVITTKEKPEAPNMPAAPSVPGKVLRDVFHEAGSEVYLDGVFKTINNMKSEKDFKWGYFDISKDLIPKEFNKFILSPLLFDGSLRMSCLSTDGNSVPLVPTGLRSLKVFGEINDFNLVQNRNCYSYYDSTSDTCWIGINGKAIYCFTGLLGHSMPSNLPAAPPMTSVPTVVKKNDSNKYSQSLSIYRRVLVTGATGFFGAHLVHELLENSSAEVFCLVRGKSSVIGAKRLEANLKEYGFWKPDYSSRIHVVSGDLTKKYFGMPQEEFAQLAKQIEHVFHGGAKIAWSATYEELEDVNVNGCRNVLDLTQFNPISISYISTLATLFNEAATDLDYLDEDTDPRLFKTGLGGYTESKRVGEQVMLDAKDKGVNIRIFRPGLLCGPVNNPYLNKDYFFTSVIKYIAQSGKGYRAYNSWDITPTDFAVRSILYLSNPAVSQRSVFNIINPFTRSSVEIADMICSFGYPVEMVSTQDWFNQVVESVNRPGATEHPFANLRPILNQDGSHKMFIRYMTLPKVNSQKTMKELQGSGIVCPPFDGKFFQKYFESAIRNESKKQMTATADTSGFGLPAPPAATCSRYVPTLKLSPLLKTAQVSTKKLVVIHADEGTKHRLQFSRPIEKSFTLNEVANGLTLNNETSSDVFVLFDLSRWPNPLKDLSGFKQSTEIITDFCYKLCRTLPFSPGQSVVIQIANCYSAESGWHPLTGVIRGFFKAITWEYPDSFVRVVLTDKDCQSTTQLLEAELGAPSNQNVVLYKEGQRFTFELLQKNDFENHHQPYFKKDSVVLFTGGSRGIGGFLSMYMAKKIPTLKLVIIGRSVPNTFADLKKEMIQTFGSATKESFIKYYKEKWGADFSVKKALSQFSRFEAEEELMSNLEQLKATGVDFEYFACDVGDAEKLKSVVQKAYQKYGRIDTVIHCAGTESSKKIVAKTWDEFEKVFKIKIDGFINLASALKMNEVKLWVNFGSHTSFRGNDGQTDYTAANDTLNILNQFYNHNFPQSRFMTVNWPGWGDVGMVPQNIPLRDVMLGRGFVPLKSEDGGLWFLHELISGAKGDTQVFFYPDGDYQFFEGRQEKRGA